MEFRNLTPFPALAFDSLDQRDITFHTVVMRLTFEVQGDGQLAFAPEQTPLADTDVYFGELNQSSVREESDFAPYKPNTDVIVNAHAYAPRAEPASRFRVGIKISDQAESLVLPPPPQGLNPLQSPSREDMQTWRQQVEKLKAQGPHIPVIIDKQLNVTGPRSWKKRYLLTRALSLFSLPAWKLSQPEKMSTLPLRYEYAYGGDNKILINERAAKRVPKKIRIPGKEPVSDSDNAPSENEIPAIAHTAYVRNTVGKGYADSWYLRAKKSRQLPAPQIESLNQRISKFGKHYEPQGFGFTARAWQPRLALAGTYDQHWLDHRHPYLPADFNFAYWNGAPTDQQITPYLDGNETITLTNLCPESTPGSFEDKQGNTQLKLKLPGHLPFVLVRFEEGQLGELAARLDTLIIDAVPEPDQGSQKIKVICIWRATIAALPEVRVLEARMIAQADVARLRAQPSAEAASTATASV